MVSATVSRDNFLPAEKSTDALISELMSSNARNSDPKKVLEELERERKEMDAAIFLILIRILIPNSLALCSPAETEIHVLVLLFPADQTHYASGGILRRITQAVQMGQERTLMSPITPLLQGGYVREKLVCRTSGGPSRFFGDFCK